MAIRLSNKHERAIFHIGLHEDSAKLKILEELSNNNFDLCEIPYSRIHSKLERLLHEFLDTGCISPKDEHVPLPSKLDTEASKLVANASFELILFYNFDKNEISSFLRDFKAATDERIEFKAALTDRNLSWSILFLFRELFDEHNFIKNINILNMGIKLSRFRFPEENYSKNDYEEFSNALKEAANFMAFVTKPILDDDNEPEPHTPLIYFVKLMRAARKLDEKNFYGEDFQRRMFPKQEILNLIEQSEDKLNLSTPHQNLMDAMAAFEENLDQETGAIFDEADDNFGAVTSNPFTSKEDKESDSSDISDEQVGVSSVSPSSKYTRIEDSGLKDSQSSSDNISDLERAKNTRLKKEINKHKDISELFTGDFIKSDNWDKLDEDEKIKKLIISILEEEEAKPNSRVIDFTTDKEEMDQELRIMKRDLLLQLIPHIKIGENTPKELDENTIKEMIDKAIQDFAVEADIDEEALKKLDEIINKDKDPSNKKSSYRKLSENRNTIRRSKNTKKNLKNSFNYSSDNNYDDNEDTIYGRKNSPNSKKS